MDERMSRIIADANLSGKNILSAFASCALDDDELGTLHPGVQAGIKQLAEGRGVSPETALYGPGYHASHLFEFVGFTPASRTSVSCGDSEQLLDCYTVDAGLSVVKVYVRIDDIESNSKRSQVETLCEAVSTDSGAVGYSDCEQIGLSFVEFKQLRSQGLIRAGIEEGTAVRLIDHLPTNCRMAHYF